ncbi:uncharacterized protein SAMN05421759_11141 [Roseivivax lentus]|uniref:Radical SAM core domain-containing protein n=2 Tax=Roseivivax lentus TaxID=633194 RepID=A0A1N7NYW2_9RHOB|nr:uncharacterized protein SAMN05421759_11141 [Roseivivax lentus]
MQPSGDWITATDAQSRYLPFQVDDRFYLYAFETLNLFEVPEPVYAFALGPDHPDGAKHPPDLTLAGPVGDALVTLEAEIDAALSEPDEAPRDGLGSVALHVAHDCNLRCPYCFAQQGHYGGPREMMTPETAAKAVDWLMGESGSRPSVRVKFFGGEPMMNMKTMRSTVAHAHARSDETGQRIGFHVTTNGTFLGEREIDFLEDNGVGVQVSIDGSPEEHDKLRVFENGAGSYSVVQRGLRRLNARKGGTIVRGTISADVPQVEASVWSLIDDEEVTDVAMEPALTTPTGEHMTTETADRIIAQWSSVADEFVARVRRGKKPPVGNILKYLKKIHKRQRTRYGCGAGLAYMAVDPSGDVWPCHRFVGEDGWKMGNIQSPGVDEDIRDRFAGNTVDQREPCASCWARYTCGGKCAHEALQATGEISDPDPLRCRIERGLTAICVATYAQLGPDLVARLFDPDNAPRVSRGAQAAAEAAVPGE